MRGPRPDIGNDTYGGFGLGKVRGVPGPGDGYMSHAEEIMPFMTAGGQSTPYRESVRDNNPLYAHGSYSSAASDTNFVWLSTYSSVVVSVPPGAMSPLP